MQRAFSACGETCAPGTTLCCQRPVLLCQADDVAILSNDTLQFHSKALHNLIGVGLPCALGLGIMGNKAELSWHSQTMGSEPDTCTVCLANEFASSSALYPLWQDGDLCDVELITSDGAVVPAHKVVLASASPMLKALMCSTGLSMRERALLTQGR